MGLPGKSLAKFGQMGYFVLNLANAAKHPTVFDNLNIVYSVFLNLKLSQWYKK
jgi:hypothetical protein